MFKTHRTYHLSTEVKNNSIAVFQDNNKTLVLYHQTIVFSRTGKTVTLNTGGWNTVSTRAVINRAISQTPTLARLHVENKKKVLVLTDSITNKSTLFKDGMRIKIYG